MEKLEFDVTNVWEYTNGKTGETFVKLQLVRQLPERKHNGCMIKQSLVLYFTCASTELKVGDKFIYDDAIMATYERTFVREDGKEGRQLNIRMRNELD